MEFFVISGGYDKGFYGRYHKPKTTTTISQEFEKEDKQQAGEFFISIASTSFFMSYGYHFQNWIFD